MGQLRLNVRPRQRVWIGGTVVEILSVDPETGRAEIAVSAPRSVNIIREDRMSDADRAERESKLAWEL